VRDYLAQNHGGSFDAAFGKGNGKAIMHATAGSIIGIGEIVILPLDVLKIKRQTNPEAFRGRGLIAIIRDEGFGLYRGWGWTAARNAPGSFAVSTFFIILHQYDYLTYCHSYSEVQLSPKSTSTNSRTTMLPAGARTSSLRSLVPLHLSSSLPLSTSSKLGSRTGTSTTRRVASRLFPT
jgi:hypothetical protein